MRADSIYISQSSSKLYFVVDSENTTATQCYNISANFQAQGICDIMFGQTCDSVHLRAHLSKNNESDPVSITGDSAQVVVEVPDQCKCSSPSSDSNIDNITASVLSVAVAIAIVGVIVVIIFFCRKTKTLATTKIIEE